MYSNHKLRCVAKHVDIYTPHGVIQGANIQQGKKGLFARVKGQTIFVDPVGSVRNQGTFKQRGVEYKQLKFHRSPLSYYDYLFNRR